MATGKPVTAGRFQPGEALTRAVTQRLDGRDVRRLANEAQVVRIVSGSAWISLDGSDILVKRGEQADLEPGLYPPVISSINGLSVVYEVWK